MRLEGKNDRTQTTRIWKRQRLTEETMTEKVKRSELEFWCELQEQQKHNEGSAAALGLLCSDKVEQILFLFFAIII